MSIINEALKKLQNQINHNEYSQSPHLNRSMEKNSTTTAQQERFQTVMTEEPEPISNKSQQKTPEPPQESHLALILMILCLLTGLFVPIFNRQSIITIAHQQFTQLTKRFQTPPVVKETQIASPELPSTAPELTNTPQPSAISKALVTSSDNPLPAATPPAVNKNTNRPQSRLIINGILTQGEKNLVLIDGQIYEEGTTVDDIKILKVTPKGVTILEDGEERFVKVMGL